MIPKVKFVTDKRKQAEYVCWLAGNISKNFYQNAGMPVLPRQVASDLNVHFPDLGYSKEFWAEIGRFKRTGLTTKQPTKAVAEVLRKLEKWSSDKFPDLGKIKADWVMIESTFHDKLTILYPTEVLAKIKEIEILITPFGTEGSFCPEKIKGGYRVYATHRSDFPGNSVGQKIVLAINNIITTPSKAETGTLEWRLRLAGVQYLIHNTKLFGPLISTSSQKMAGAALLLESESYLQRLGFGRKKIITKADDSLVINGTIVNGKLSAQERLVLDYFIDNPARVIGYDELADLMWGELAEEKFSLYAISRVIANLRTKILDFGVHKKVIINERGKGYMLCN